MCSTLLLIFSIWASSTFAQIKVQVVSQEINKKFEWDPGMSVVLSAEHAEIYCLTHKANTIDIDITIISKHEDRNTAEADLKKMTLLTEVDNNVLCLRNYIELARNESKPESALSIIYHIRIPENCPADIRNYFGKMEIQNLQADLKINSEFCKIELSDISGKTTINSVFGNITASHIQCELSVTSNRSDINLSNFGGKLTINAMLANISLAQMNNIKTLSIEAQKSMVSIRNIEIIRYAYQFDLKNCDFKNPESMILNYARNEKGEIKAGYNTGNGFPLFEFDLTNGSLTIE